MDVPGFSSLLLLLVIFFMYFKKCYFIYTFIIQKSEKPVQVNNTQNKLEARSTPSQCLIQPDHCIGGTHNSRRICVAPAASVNVCSSVPELPLPPLPDTLPRGNLEHKGGNDRHTSTAAPQQQLGCSTANLKQHTLVCKATTHTSGKHSG